MNTLMNLFTKGSRIKKALVDLGNLIANKKRISIDDLAQIPSSNSLSVEDLKDGAKSIIEKHVLNFFTVDRKRDDILDIKEKVSTVISYFHLPENTCQKVIDEYTEKYLRKYMDSSVSDGTLTEGEEELFQDIATSLGIPRGKAEAISKEVRTGYINRFFKDMVSDRRVSPDEYERFERQSKALMVNVSLDSETSKLVDKFKLLWQIEHNEIPIMMNPGIILQRQEECYFVGAVSWHEIRKQTVGGHYGGVSYRKKIAGGFYLRAGSIGVKPVSQDVLTLIDQGTIYLTNKRLLFRGEKGNKTIAFNSIIDLEIYTNGVQIERSTGKSPFLEFTYNVEVFAAILNQVL